MILSKASAVLYAGAISTPNMMTMTPTSAHASRCASIRAATQSVTNAYSTSSYTARKTASYVAS